MPKRYESKRVMLAMYVDPTVKEKFTRELGRSIERTGKVQTLGDLFTTIFNYYMNEEVERSMSFDPHELEMPF